MNDGRINQKIGLFHHNPSLFVISWEKEFLSRLEFRKICSGLHLSYTKNRWTNLLNPFMNTWIWDFHSIFQIIPTYKQKVFDGEMITREKNDTLWERKDSFVLVHVITVDQLLCSYNSSPIVQMVCSLLILPLSLYSGWL